MHVSSLRRNSINKNLLLIPFPLNILSHMSNMYTNLVYMVPGKSICELWFTPTHIYMYMHTCC